MASGWTIIRQLHAAVPDRLLLGLVVGIMLAAAYLVQRFVERPVGRLLRREM
jgi:peptidoglycan/LPS O-acetylase OafA/YrhL